MEATKKGFDFKKFMSDNAMWFVLIILAVALTAVRPRFATVGNLTTLISSESVKGIITCGVCWYICRQLFVSSLLWLSAQLLVLSAAGWSLAHISIRLSRRWVHSSYVELWQRCTPISRYPIWIRASVISPFTKSAAFRWLYSSS